MSLDINIQLPRRDFTMNLNLSIGNQLTGIYGHSGAGKTSFLHLIAGLERPESGTITFNGRTIVDTKSKVFVKPRKRRIGIVFQESRLFNSMSIKKNLLFGTRYSKKDKPLISFDEVVGMLELEQLLEFRPSHISGGEARRVAIGRALLSSPELLLLDEPFSAVDVSLRQQILPFIERIKRRLNIPIMVISHDLPDLLQLTDKLILMKKGEIVGNGDFFDLLEQPGAFELIHSTGIVNVLEMEVAYSENEDMAALIAGRDDDTVEIKVGYHGLPDATRVKAAIAPNDIILCTEKVMNTSAHNLLHGTIEKITKRPAHSICVVAIGADKRLAVQVTQSTLNELNLKVGSDVYCLFKANAVNVVAGE